MTPEPTMPAPEPRCPKCGGFGDQRLCMDFGRFGSMSHYAEHPICKPCTNDHFHATPEPPTPKDEASMAALQEAEHLLALALAEEEKWERRAVPCGCERPLGGFIPGQGPRCRLCNTKFAVVPLSERQALQEAREALERIKARAQRVVDGQLECTAFSVADYDLQVATPALATHPSPSEPEAAP